MFSCWSIPHRVATDKIGSDNLQSGAQNSNWVSHMSSREQTLSFKYSEKKMDVKQRSWDWKWDSDMGCEYHNL